jgi:hypothetical protein
MRLNRNTYTLFLGMQISPTTIESSMEISWKAKDRTAIWSSCTTPGILPKEPKSGCNRDTCIPMIIAALFTIAKLWKQPRCCTPKALQLESYLQSICPGHFGNRVLRNIYPSGPQTMIYLISAS